MPTPVPVRTVQVLTVAWNQVSDVGVVKADVDWRTSFRYHDSGDFPATEHRLGQFVVTVPEKRNVVDEVGKEILPDVVRRIPKVILPASVRIRNHSQVTAAIAADCRIMGVRVGESGLILQVIREPRAAQGDLKRIVVSIRFVTRQADAVVPDKGHRSVVTAGIRLEI